MCNYLAVRLSTAVSTGLDFNVLVVMLVVVAQRWTAKCT